MQPDTVTETGEDAAEGGGARGCGAEPAAGLRPRREAMEGMGLAPSPAQHRDGLLGSATSVTPAVNWGLALLGTSSHLSLAETGQFSTATF